MKSIVWSIWVSGRGLWMAVLLKKSCSTDSSFCPGGRGGITGGEVLDGRGNKGQEQEVLCTIEFLWRGKWKVRQQTATPCITAPRVEWLWMGFCFEGSREPNKNRELWDRKFWRKLADVWMRNLLFRILYVLVVFGGKHSCYRGGWRQQLTLADSISGRPSSVMRDWELAELVGVITKHKEMTRTSCRWCGQGCWVLL